MKRDAIVIVARCSDNVTNDVTAVLITPKQRHVYRRHCLAVAAIPCLLSHRL